MNKHENTMGVTLNMDLARPWKMAPNEAGCSGAEFEMVCDSLDEDLIMPLRKRKRLGTSDFYLLGDFYHQRTQVIMVGSPTFLDCKFIVSIREFLARTWPCWRVAVCLPQKRDRLIVYASTFVCKAKRFEDACEALSELDL